STLAEIFDHQKHSIEWRKVESLLNAVGTVTREHNGHLKVEVGPETETFHAPHSKDIDRQMLVDLRRMLTEAGYGPDGKPVADERDRDYPDNRWGDPEDQA
ncbi:MAG: hypothetical protein KDB54_11220, partial [Solirubrobacterales bacterium]|nr:hypothetical protein [Solirubrobacterales bacterium]